MTHPLIDVLITKDHPNAEIPKYGSEYASGFDLTAVFDTEYNKSLTIPPGGRALISTGLKFAIPYGFELQIRPRSGLASKNGITVVNTPGTVDADYRGVVKVILLNTSNTAFTVNEGDRIAQGVISPVFHAIFAEVEELPQTVRGSKGFGSTGI